MSIIYSYPIATPSSSDLFVFSDSSSTPKYATRQATLSSIKDALGVVDSLTASEPIQLTGSSLPTGTIAISSRAYGGGTTTGHVPSGGSAGQYLDGTGAWVTASGSGTVTGTGTHRTLAMWNAGGAGIENSIVQQNSTGDTLSINANSININAIITHASDPDTFIGFQSPDNFEVTTNGTEKFKADENKLMLYYGGNIQAETLSNGFLLLGDGSTNASKLQFNCSNNNHNVNIIGPDHTGSPLSYSLTLPNKIAEQTAYATGGRVLESNASGALQWIATPSGGGGGGGTVTSIAALTLGTTGTDLSSTVAGGTTDAVITLQVPSASASNRGALTSTDWTTFNSKTANTGTVTTVSSTTAGDALDVAVTNASTTPAVGFTWAGSSSQYVDGAGNLTTFPTIPANTNIANTELTLNANRILALSSYSLKFTGTNIVQFSNQGSARNLSVLVDHNLEVDGQAWVNSYDYGESTGTVNIDWNDGNVQEFTLSGVVAWTCTNQKAGGTYIMIVNQPAGQSYTQSFSQSFDWADNNTAPATTTAERADVYSFVCRTSNGSMLGTFSQNFI